MTYHRWTCGNDAWGTVPIVFARLPSGQRDRATYDANVAELAVAPHPAAVADVAPKLAEIDAILRFNRGRELAVSS